jgi:hypothetical protein
MKTLIILFAILLLTNAQSKIANLYQTENAKLTYMAKAKSNGDVTNSFRLTLYNQFYFQSKITKDYLFGKEDQQLKFEIGLFF